LYAIHKFLIVIKH